ncbi:MAG: helicase C-terminal domain-containing protein [Chloroflexota bacterium]|nr:helicase C-terminal domain-containing protein [Chloroflexota bacterium]
MIDQTYISIDLETTGLNPKLDEIIEIGAVKFTGNEITGTFNSLINPLCTVPYRIRVLCGIDQAQLDTAPTFSDIADEFNTFAEGHSIVGHNISFDLGFLEGKGFKTANMVYDTWELSTILLFQQPDYSLASLTKELGLSVPQHRALPDALAAKDLFVRLLDRAIALDLTTIEELVRISEKSDWEQGLFFRELLKFKTKSAFVATGDANLKDNDYGITIRGEDDESPLVARAEIIPLDIESLSNILEPAGVLAQSLPDYEHRPGQVCMMQAVSQALSNNEHLIVEAGTGTGKSVAYLLPSIIFALENSVPVVISTNTINLQEQLIGKDIPALLQTLELWPDRPMKRPKVVQLKGRANYICMKRYNALRANDSLSGDEAKLLARITVWLRSTKTGDRAELNIHRNEFASWDKLCANLDESIEKQCPYLLKGACFLYQARQAAENAHLIVVNHALLMSDMIADAKILPHYDHLVIDEAHHLEDEATNQLGYQVTQWDLFSYVNRFEQKTEGQRYSGLLAWLRDCFRGSTVSVARQRQLNQLTESLSTSIDRAQLYIPQFFDRLRDFIQSNTHGNGEYSRYLLLTPANRTQPAWSRVMLAWEDLSLVFKDIADDLGRLHDSFENLSDNRISGYEHLLLELSLLFFRSHELYQQLMALITYPESGSIYWLSLNNQNSTIGLHATLLSVAQVLENSLFSTKDCVILTGATLSTEGNFEYVKDRLGLEHANELILGAPFDYPASTMIYIPSDIPDPNSKNYQKTLESTLIELCSTCQGRTLVLFTSHTALRTTKSAIQTPLEENGILVLGQGVDGSPKQLLSTFKANPKAVLLGTSSFWEGVDISGDTLSVLVIAKLPFNVPTDPIFAARSQLFDNPFYQFSIPQAAIRFKQGFGRLIRSKTDRGALVLFDKRLQTKGYRSAFFDSIPQCTVVKGTTQELPLAISQWLDKDRSA